jgi:bacterioferritin
LLENVEAQIDWIESQQYVIDHSSIENYLQSMMA